MTNTHTSDTQALIAPRITIQTKTQHPSHVVVVCHDQVRC